MAAENKAAIKELRGLVQELRERQLKIETRMESLDEVVSTKAQATAALAVAHALAPLMERLARSNPRARTVRRGCRLRAEQSWNTLAASGYRCGMNDSALFPGRHTSRGAGRDAVARGLVTLAEWDLLRDAHEGR